MSNLSPAGITDLELSGLEPRDIAARKVTPAELAPTGHLSQTSYIPDGYVIPYFDLNGDLLPYYRVKILDVGANTGPKYRGLKDKPNHIYFPPQLPKLLKSGQHQFLIITEGEKKAACAVKMGFPCIALSGVDCWRNRSLYLPEDTQFVALKGRKVIQAKIPAGDSNDMVSMDTGVVATGFAELVDLLISTGMEAIIIYDTDKKGIKAEVQRAAAQLGYELRYRGLPITRIRQLMLPPSKLDEKIGLDDYLVRRGVKDFATILRVCRAKRIAFPRHPNPNAFVASRLQKARLTRKEQQDVALSILMELETRGRRLRNKATQDLFFFNEQTHTLMPVHLGSQRILLHDTTFGSYLYREFNLSATDVKIVGWLAAQVNGEPGVDDTVTHKVLAKPTTIADTIAYQLSDSHFVIITPNPERPYIICENGMHGVLFEQGCVDPLSYMDIEVHLDHHIETDEVLWQQALAGFNFTPSSPMNDDVSKSKSASEIEQLRFEGRQLAVLLYYLSPWFLRWKGLQLPVELTIGEPGCGKSSLYELRQTIITGIPQLSNMTNDIKDWYAGITSRGGLFVLDNVHFTASARDYQQRLSDELCRLVTEPNPHVEMRKLYTTAEIVSLPVTTTFAVTSIEQPFITTDLIQRAAIFELQVIQAGHEANWVKDQIARGDGRIGWVGHQLAIIHKFLHLAIFKKRWNPNYRAGHRLAHYEQALMLMAEVLGMDSKWIPSALKRQTAVKMSEVDWTIAALEEFSKGMKQKHGAKYPTERFGVKEIVEWAEQHDTYSTNGTITNGWRLSKYIKSHRGILTKTLGLTESGTHNNRTLYSLQ